MPTAFPLSPTPPYAWIAIIVSSSIVLSFGLACAVPFAALAAIAALTLERRDALLLVGLAWLANQAVGFGLLHYPWTADTLAWGLALLFVSVLATFGAGFCVSRFESLPRMVVALTAFLSAFVVYEGSLALVTISLGSDAEPLRLVVVAKIFVANALAFAMLYAAGWLYMMRERRTPAAPQPTV